MFDRLRLWTKIMLMMGLAIGGVGAVLTFTNLTNLTRVVQHAERSALSAHYQAIANAVAAESRTAQALASLVASMPLVQEKFDAGDRKALSDVFVPGFKSLVQDVGIEQFQFHTAPATSWLRVHLPAKFGDDLSTFRHTVVQSNQTQKPVRGLEGGVAGLGVRGVVPVQHHGRHVGTVEFGMGLGQAFFEQFKKHNGVDVGMYVADAAAHNFKTLASTLGKEPLLDTATLQRVLAGEPHLEHRTV